MNDEKTRFDQWCILSIWQLWVFECFNWTLSQNVASSLFLYIAKKILKFIFLDSAKFNPTVILINKLFWNISATIKMLLLHYRPERVAAVIRQPLQVNLDDAKLAGLVFSNDNLLSGWNVLRNTLNFHKTTNLYSRKHNNLATTSCKVDLILDKSLTINDPW